jgi:hypothetical protein
MLAAQIKKSVFEPDVLRVIRLGGDRHGQLVGRPEHFDVGDEHLDCAGRQVGIFRPGRALAHLALDPHHPLRTQRLGELERARIGIDHALRDAVMVAQVDEQEPAMVADAMAPSRQAHDLADVALTQLPAGVGAITVHVSSRKAFVGNTRRSGRTSTCTASLVKARQHRVPAL